MELKITKEKVLAAAEKCNTAKDVLKSMFPEAFDEIIEYDESKIYAYQSYQGNNTVYKLHRVLDKYSFMSMNSSNHNANGATTAEEQLARAKNWAIEGRVNVFSSQKDFAAWFIKVVSQ